MIVYLSSINELKDAASYDAAFLRITEERKNSVLKFASVEDRKRSIVAGLLLNYIFKEWCCRESDPADGKKSPDVVKISVKDLLSAEKQNFTVCKKENGKPFFAENPGIHYNLSHSKDYVVCAVSEKEIGADIQYAQRNCKESFIKKIMTESEYLKFVNMEPERKKLFPYCLWTVKESACKYTGKGLKQDFQDMEVDFEKSRVHILSNDEFISFRAERYEKNYVLSVCYK